MSEFDDVKPIEEVVKHEERTVEELIQDAKRELIALVRRVFELGERIG